MTEWATAGETTQGTGPRGGGPETFLESYRVELTAYCYRMLGSAFEAEDNVLEAAGKLREQLDGDILI
jgi:RNA polymerase sigma-70 factor (ECF subfamily)